MSSCRVLCAGSTGMLQQDRWVPGGHGVWSKPSNYGDILWGYHIYISYIYIQTHPRIPILSPTVLGRSFSFFLRDNSGIYHQPEGVYAVGFDMI